MLWSVIRLICKTSSVTPNFFYVFNLILSFSTCSQSLKKICAWELLGANVLNRQLPSTSPTVQQHTNPNTFTEEQITKIKQLVQDSVAAAARDIAREAAHAATGVLQSQAPSSSQVIPSAQAMSQDTPGGAAILGPQE